MTIRFPLANDSGVQETFLRILPGGGRYIAVNPWNLSHRLLGDEDGDQGFVLLRVKDLIEGRLSKANRPRLAPSWDLPEMTGHLTLQGALDPRSMKLSKKFKGRMETPQLNTWEARKGATQDADTRQHVAVYTMAIGWWVSRTLMQSRKMGTQEAHRAGYNSLGWFMENCMDARKGDSAMSGARGFDKYALMSTLMWGGDLDFQGLKQLGIPDQALKVLRTAWAVSGGQLRDYCAQSPVYKALIIERGQMEQTIPGMLLALQEMGVPPSEVYRAIVEDLTVVSGQV